LCITAKFRGDGPLRVNCTHYRAAGLLSASPPIPAVNISRTDRL
jgi:hypothetical protein